MEDAKQEIVESQEKTSEQIVDEALNGVSEEQETPSEPSAEKQPQETETTETEEPSAEDEKTESSEEKEEEVPKEFHKHPAWQRILKERDEAREAAQKFESSDFESKLEKFNNVTSSPAYIKASMQAEGYTPEAISAKLQELGHAVETPTQDGVKAVLNELGVDMTTLTQEQKDYVNTQVADMVKVSDIRFKHLIENFKANELGAIRKDLGAITQSAAGNRMVTEMKNVVKEDGVLDFTKDVEPVLQKFMDENPKATQDDVYSHFRDINKELIIQRLTTQAKKGARDEAKSKSRPNKASQTLEPGQMPERKEGQAIGDYIDDLMDAQSINS